MTKYCAKNCGFCLNGIELNIALKKFIEIDDYTDFNVCYIT